MLVILFLARRVAHFLLCEIQRQKHFPFKRQRKKCPGPQILLISTGQFRRRRRQAWLFSVNWDYCVEPCLCPRDIESEFHGKLDKLLRVVRSFNLSAKRPSSFANLAFIFLSEKV